MKQELLPFTVGVEYTFLSPAVFTGTMEEFKGDLGMFRDHHERFPEDHWVALLQEKGYKQAHRDGKRIVEVPSPIHKTMSGVKSFYDKLNKNRKKLGLKTHETRFERGNTIDEMPGGGHVHLGMPKFKNEEEKRQWWLTFTTAVTNRPWLNWIFNFWGDDWNANNIFGTRHKPYAKIYLKSFAYWELFDKMNGDKDLAVIPRVELNTIEWRIFDAPKDFKDVENYINFAMTFTKRSYDERNNGERGKTLRVRNLKDIKMLNKDDSWNEFNELLDVLGLDKKKYRRYKKNLNDRYAYGKLV